MFARHRSAQNIAMGLIWLSFVVYGVVFSPNDEQVFDIAILLSSFGIPTEQDVPASIKSMFLIMGGVPLILALKLLSNSHHHTPSPIWFIAGSFALGAGALLPYFALRQAKPIDSQTRTKPKISLNPVMAVLNSNAFCFCAGLTVICFAAYITLGPESLQYWNYFATSRLVNVMTVDFGLLMFLIWPICLRDGLKGTYNE